MIMAPVVFFHSSLFLCTHAWMMLLFLALVMPVLIANSTALPYFTPDLFLLSKVQYLSFISIF